MSGMRSVASSAYSRSYGGGGSYGACGSKTCTHANQRPFCCAIHDVAAATSWIAQQKGRWFAWVHVFDPHAPYEPPPPYDRQYADAPYAGEVAFTDFALGPLLDAARDGSGRPTLVIVTGCLLYTSDAADEEDSVDLGGRRI